MRPGGVVAAAAIAVVAVVATGCAGGSDGTEPPGPLSRETATAAGKRRGGVLRIGAEQPTSLDPARARTVPQSDLVVADLLFDGLTAFDPSSGEAVPALATSWESSDDVRRWTFRLDSSAQFADGSPVTSEDVRFTLERVRELGGESEGAGLLELLEGVDAVGGDVRIRLREPMSTLPLVLTSPSLGVVPREQAAQPDFGAAPVGSGPFVIDHAAEGLLRLVRATGADTYLDGVELRFYESVQSAYESFTAGDTDWSLVPSGQVGAAIDAGHGHVSPYQAVLFYGINVENPQHPGLTDRRFREAIVLAVDRSAIAREVYGRGMSPWAGVAAAGAAGVSDSPCTAACSHDVDRSRELVDAVFGERPVPTVFVDFDTGGRQQQVAEMIVAELEAAGIPAEARPRSFEEYKSFLVSGRQAVFRLGWTGGYPSAEAYLEPLFRSGAPDNVVGLSVKEIDETLDAARREVDHARRARLLADAERLVMERLPVLPIGQFQTAWAASEHVRDLVMSVSGTFDASSVWLAADS